MLINRLKPLKTPLFCFLLLLNWCFSFAMPFRTYTVNEGLTLNEVRGIYQDKHMKYIWIYTQNGLNRYNGHGLQKLYIQRDSLKSNNLINDIAEDKGNNIWLASNYGLAQFNYISNKWQQLPPKLQTGVYKHICFFNDTLMFGVRNNSLVALHINGTHISLQTVNIQAKTITDIAVMNHELIIGTSNGIYRYNPFNRKVKKMLREITFCSRLKYIAQDNSVWIQKNKACYLVPVEDGKLSRAKMIDCHQVLLHQTGIDYQISDITFANNTYWLATQTGAVSVNKSTHEVSHLKGPNYWMNSVLIDHTGNLWCGTWQKGVVKFSNKRKLFYTYRKTDNDNGIPSELISGMLELDSNRIALASETKGLVVFNRSKQNFKELYNTSNTKPNSPYYVPHHIMHCIKKDGEGRLWGGYYNEGFNVIAGKNKSKINKAIALFLDKQGRVTCDDFYFDPNNKHVYIASSKGVFLVDIESLEISNLIKNKNVSALLKDTADNLWLGCKTGLSIYKLHAESSNAILEQKAKVSGLFSDGITCFYPDSENNIWIGTYGDGLYRYTAQTGTFEHIQAPSHIDYTVVYSIVEDNLGKIWLGTNSGLIGFDQAQDRFWRYSKSDGIQDNQFNYNSALKASGGTVFMGGIAGFTYFNPQHIKNKAILPKPVISDITIGENRVNTIQEAKYPETLTISYTTNSFEISFYTPDYTAPENYIYKYILEGYTTKERLCPPNTSNVFFTNVPPGKYVLKIAVTLPNTDWSELATSPVIIVLPPWYKSSLAYFVYTVLLIGLFVITYYITRKQALYKNSIALAKLEQKQAEQINQAKLRFFTDIAHEIRTPLTLIIGPVKDVLIKRNLDKGLHNSLTLVHKSAAKLMGLMDELLLFRKAESGALPLKLQEHNLVNLIHNTCELYRYDMAEKEISLSYPMESEIKMVFDAEKIEKVLSNLISNAIKHTPRNGEISIRIQKKEKEFVTSVQDTGKGIPKDELDTIFNRFYQSTANHEQGFGIGLALAKRIVEAHEGQLHVSSTPGKGSTFSVSIPQLKPNIQPDLQQAQDAVQNDNFEKIKTVPHKNAIKGSILIVEDNAEISQYIAGIFESEYKLSIKGNGREGFAHATSHMPDIIITDYQMPEMDGITMCKKLKQEFITSHIPVILLSAYQEVEEQLKGLKVGADDYIGKPFHAEVLLQKIGNILQSRKQLVRSFKSGDSINLSKFEQQDQRFLDRLNKIIASEMSNEAFGVPVLCDKLGISKTTLNDKLRKMLDVSTAEYIKKSRLKEAYNLLTTRNYTPSDAAYAVGYTPAYFTTCFKKEYGVPPGKI